MVLGIVVACAVLALTVSLIAFARVHAGKTDRESTEAVDPLLGEIEVALRDSVLVEQARRKIREAKRTRG